MTSYLLTCSFYQKVSRYNVFQYKISDQWERIFIFEKALAFCEFSPDFQSESGFDLTKIRGIEMRGSLQCIEKNVLTPLLNRSKINIKK